MSKRPYPEDLLQSYFDDLLEGAETPSPTTYADPLVEQRQRLQKLLYSAVPTPVQEDLKPSVVEPAPVFVASSPSDLKVALAEPLVDTPLVAEAVQVTTTEMEFQVAPVDIETEPTEFEYSETKVGAEDLPLAEEYAYQARDLEWLDNGRPVWAQKRFDVLLFKVSGLTLAVPLISLGQIQPLTEALTPLFGQVDWFMGIQPTPAGKISTVNTAKFVMPERYDPEFVNTAKYVISIDGVPWGLAVDAVNQPISLQPEDVKWRTERSRRPWLAGTVKDQMCALLDIPRIGQLLMEAQASRSRRVRHESGR